MGPGDLWKSSVVSSYVLNGGNKDLPQAAEVSSPMEDPLDKPTALSRHAAQQLPEAKQSGSQPARLAPCTRPVPIHILHLCPLSGWLDTKDQSPIWEEQDKLGRIGLPAFPDRKALSGFWLSQTSLKVGPIPVRSR